VGTWKTIALSVGTDTLTTLKGSFTAPENADVLTGRLTLDNEAGLEAEARCRIIVDGPAVTTPPPPSTDPGPGTDPGTDPGSDPPPGFDDRPHGDPVDLTGNFALVTWDAQSLTQGALDPPNQCGAVAQVSLVSIAQTGTSLHLESKFCSVKVPNMQAVLAGVQQTEVPQPLIDSIPTIAMDMVLDRAKTGADFFAPFVSHPVVTGTLPTDPAAASDDDHDGENGVTVIVTNQFLTLDESIVYRHETQAFSGTIASSDEIDGDAPGSYAGTGDSSLLSYLSGGVPTSAPLPSTFRMTRTAATTCDDLDVNAVVAAFPPTLNYPPVQVPNPNGDGTTVPAPCPSF
jgi:hypothetical protein